MTAVFFDPARWVQPQTLSVFAELAPTTDVAALRTQLERAAPGLALDALARLHYLRLFVVEPARDLRNRPLPGRLVLSVVFDGTAREFLDDWIGRARTALMALFSRCAGFPTGAGPREFRDWLLARAVRPQTYFIGAVRHTTAMIREESRLFGALQARIDAQQRAGNWAHGDPQRIHAELRDFVLGRDDLPHTLCPGPSWGVRLLAALDVARITAILLGPPVALAWLAVPAARHSFWWWLLAAVVLAVSAVSGYALVLRWFERTEAAGEVTPAPGHAAAVVAREDFLLQNQFTMLSLVRDSWFRRWHLRLVLFLSNSLSRHWWNRGELVGIGTIHFARIHQIDGGRRMLFLSDFDGSWERYLFDFLDVGAFAVVPNWTNLHGCPPARWGLRPTPGFAQKFLPFTRANQIGTELWFCALPHVSMADLLRNARVRDGLFRPLDAAAARAWLALF